MSNGLNSVKILLLSGGFTAVVKIGDEIITSEERGINFLFNLCKKGASLAGAAVADKAVGKAAALFLAHLNVSSVYAGIITSDALEILKDSNIEYEYGCVVDKIINRKATDICPIEKAVENINDYDSAFKAVEIALAELGRG